MYLESEPELMKKIEDEVRAAAEKMEVEDDYVLEEDEELELHGLDDEI